jgi:hypothetical protein
MVGPGTCLERMFHLLLIEQTEECPCYEHARTMDAWGPDGCREHLNEIVEWLREESIRRKMLFSEKAARVAVKTCIKLSRWTA